MQKLTKLTSCCHQLQNEQAQQMIKAALIKLASFIAAYNLVTLHDIMLHLM